MHRCAWILAAVALTAVMPVFADEAPAPDADDSAGKVIVQPTDVEFPRATRPEPVIYTIMRKMRSLPVGPERLRLRDRLRQWRGLAHDGAVKMGARWVTAREMTARRERFGKTLAEAETLLRKAERIRPRTKGGRARRTRLRTEGRATLRRAAQTWGDPLIRDFLVGQVALLTGNGALADSLFTKCARRQPTVPAFAQGRAMARAKLGRRLDALRDRMTAFRLRNDDYEAYLAVKEAMQAVPGGKIASKAFKEAKEYLELYSPPGERESDRWSRRRGVRWLMPGDVWQGAKGSLATPAYDRIVARRTVAVPIAADGVLLCDKMAVDGAAEVLLEVARGEYTRVRPLKIGASSLKGLAVPLTAMYVGGYTFKPVTAVGEPDDESPAGEWPVVKAGDELTTYAHTLPAEMAGSTPRKTKVRVTAVGPAGDIELDGQLQPGESAAPVLTADGALVTFLAGRTDVTAENGGPNLILRPADVARYVAAAVAARRPRRSSGRKGMVVRKGPAEEVKGQILTLHILVGAGRAETKRTRY